MLVSCQNILEEWTRSCKNCFVSIQLFPVQAASIPVSSHPIKMQAKVGATLVPIAVPYTCSQNVESKMNRLQVRTNIKRVIKNSVGSFGSGRNLLLFKASLKTCIP